MALNDTRTVCSCQMLLPHTSIECCCSAARCSVPVERVFPAGGTPQWIVVPLWKSASLQLVRLAGSYRAEVRRGILAAVARVKEGDAQRALEQELLTSVELLEHAAHSAMAALLLVRLRGVLAIPQCS